MDNWGQTHKKPTHYPKYFFGYGSLMYPEGINGRGMNHYYHKSDLIPVKLQGYKRTFCAVANELAFYGIYESNDSWINGVVFPIHSLADYIALLHDEGASWRYKPPLYTLKDVRMDILLYNSSPDYERDRTVALLSNEINEKDGYMPEYYVKHVWDGIQYHGLTFGQDFLHTGGVATQQCTFNKQIKDPWIYGGTLPGARRLS
jgi:hypothetical protein